MAPDYLTRRYTTASIGRWRDRHSLVFGRPATAQLTSAPVERAPLIHRYSTLLPRLFQRSDGSSVEDDASSIISSHKSSIAGTEQSADKHGPQCTLLAPKPFCVFRGHTADVLDLSWSPRNYFLLSSGMDRTVKLWHLTRAECLCCFQHVDIVTCISFMPKVC